MTKQRFEGVGNERSFEDKKQDYFTKLGFSVREALKLHKANGLWERNEKGKRDWGNVSEHCLVEVARVRIFAKLLGLEEKSTKALMSAAALHDFFQKKKKEVIIAGELSRASFTEASRKADEMMRAARIDEGIIRLVNSVGDESLLETQKVLSKEKLSDDDSPFLVMHYVDDYTTNATWVEPCEEKDGKVLNNFDKRMDAAEANPRYKRNNEEGRAVFNGETAYEAQRRIGHIVESRLAALIGERQGKILDSLALPEFIDELIKQEIKNSES